MKPRITDEQEREHLRFNLESMRASFTGKGLSGEKLHILLRNKSRDSAFDARLKADHPQLYAALANFRSWNLVYQQTDGGKEEPTRELVEDIAAFCTAAFAFDEDVTAEKLLSRNIAPFPALRRAGERWGRYQGLYRCFYLYPDSLEDEDVQVHGGLLRLREEKGKLLCRWITGIRQDARFEPLERLLETTPDADMASALTEFSRELPPYERRLVYYEGSLDPGVGGFFMLRMQRAGHSNSALLFLRRWDSSAQPTYSGGVALAHLFRDQSKSNMACHAMLITREPMSLARERELLMRHLKYTNNDEKGLCVSVDMDRKWNQAAMEWSYRQATGKSV